MSGTKPSAISRGVRRLGLLGGLGRTEEVVELLLDLGDEVGSGPGRGGLQNRPLRQAQGRLLRQAQDRFYGMALLRAGVV